MMTGQLENQAASSRPTTYGRSRTVRLPDFDYASDHPVHLTACALSGRPFIDKWVAWLVCDTVESAAANLGFDLYGYCLMPDHLHMLVSPGDSRRPAARLLGAVKGYTTREYQTRLGVRRLWQTTAHDRVLRPKETVWRVATYIANNPVRAGLVESWLDWPYAKVFVEA